MLYIDSLKNRNIFLFLASIIIGLITIAANNPVFSLVYATFLLIVIVKKAKWSFFSELSILIWYAYFEGVLQKYSLISNSTLAWAGLRTPYYFQELTFSVISFLLIELVFVLFSDLIRKEKELYKTNLEIPYSIAILLSIASIVLIILVFPSFPTFKTDLANRRTQGLSSLYGLVLLSMVLDGITVEQSLKHKEFYLFYLFNIFWSFGHAERVEAIGLISYIVLKSINFTEYNFDKNKYKKLKKGMIVIIAFALISAMYLGLTRTSSSKVDLQTLFSSFLTQGTVGDVTYIFNCATDLWKNGHQLNGITYIDYFLRLIPGVHSSYSSETLLHTLYPDTMGGQLFFAESMMNFGLLGTFLMNIEFFGVMRIILNKHTVYRAFFFIPIVVEIFRTAYYGRGSWILSCFIEIPLIYVAIKILLHYLYTPHEKWRRV